MDSSALIALWLAISTAFSSGAEHLKQREYAEAVSQFNLVITADVDAHAEPFARQARLLRGQALCALDQRDLGLLDLMVLQREGDDATRAEADRLLTEYRFTERQRLQPIPVIEAFVKACAATDKTAALTWCKGEAKANLETLWDHPKFVAGVTATATDPFDLGPEHLTNITPYGTGFKLFGEKNVMLLLSFDDGWWITGIVAAEQAIVAFDLYHLLGLSEALIEYASAHDGDLPPALTREHLSALTDRQLINSYTKYPEDRSITLPYRYLPPPRRLSPTERRTYILAASPLPFAGLLAVGYADGHVMYYLPDELEHRLAAQAETFPPTAPTD